MAVRFFTDSPASLLKAFDAKIEQKEREGSITTWVKNHQGYYTHTSRWGKKAYLKANPDYADCLVFNVVPPVGERVEPEVYAFYHGHLIETFINHFSGKFTNAEAGGRPTGRDRLVSATAK